MDRDLILTRVYEALMNVSDPELHLNIVDLGLIYEIDLVESTVNIIMTLTSPTCPGQKEIMDGIKNNCLGVPGVDDVNVEITFSPMWNPKEHLTDDGRKYLKMMGLNF